MKHKFFLSLSFVLCFCLVACNSKNDPDSGSDSGSGSGSGSESSGSLYSGVYVEVNKYDAAMSELDSRIDEFVQICDEAKVYQSQGNTTLYNADIAKLKKLTTSYKYCTADALYIENGVFKTGEVDLYSCYSGSSKVLAKNSLWNLSNEYTRFGGNDFSAVPYLQVVSKSFIVETDYTISGNVIDEGATTYTYSEETPNIFYIQDILGVKIKYLRVGE